MARARHDLDDEVFAFIKRGYELWNEGDLSTVSEMWSDDFELHTAPEWPGQSVFYGREAAIRCEIFILFLCAMSK